MKPVFERVGYMKLTKHLGLIHEQLGEGGGERGHCCNGPYEYCDSECAKKHIYTSPDGKPLFFCRCFYTVMLGTKLIEEDDAWTSKLATLVDKDNNTDGDAVNQ